MSSEFHGPSSPLLFRDDHIRYLKAVLGITPTEHQSLPIENPAFICGYRGCGKTTLIKHVLSYSEVPSMYIDCAVFDTEIAVARAIFSGIREAADLDKPTIKARTRDWTDARKLLKLIGTDDPGKPFEIIIVLDGVENQTKCRSVLYEVLQLTRFPDTCKVQVVFISRTPWHSLIGFTPQLGDCLEICLPPYSKKELVNLVGMIFEPGKILDGADLTFLRSYCELIVEKFYPVTQDVRELRGYAQRHYPAYCDPVSKNVVSKSQKEKLWRNLLPLLVEELQGSTEKKQLAKLKADVVTMPVYLRYVLVAGFLCSYNPSKADARMTAKRHEPLKTPNKGTKKKLREKRLTVLGPQSFSFDRLFNNFSSLVADENADVTELQVQIMVKTLCDSQLLSRIGPEDNLDQPKYKCLCEKAFAQAVAKTLDLDINRYLVDLV